MNETQLDGKSADIVSQNIAQIKQLFPEVFTEDKIDLERLQEVLGEYVEDKEERYRFEWHGKSQALRLSQTPSMGTLRPCKEESKDWDTTQNLYIEGDNLEVLKLLQKSYYNKVKMIYIDPPYNTGKDFVYKDNFRDSIQNYLEVTGQTEDGVSLSTNKESSGRYHTDWLNMIYPRLRLARNLLKDDGVIFISIDDNESHNIRKNLDEIFGEENFVACIIWKKRSAPPNDKKLGTIHENILVYAKKIHLLKLYRKPRSKKQLQRYKNPDNHPKGRWASDNLMANVKGGRYVESLYYPIINPRTKQEHYPSNNGNWRFNKEKMDKLLANNEIYFGENDRGRPKLKRFLSDVQNGVPYSTIFDYCGYNTNATAEMVEFIGGVNIFDTPKPTSLISELIRLSTKDDDIVLDFFSGSGTTGNAIMRMNRNDRSKRRYILIQLPEKVSEKSEAYKLGFHNISDIGKRRINQAGDKIKTDLLENYENQNLSQMTLMNEKSQEEILNPDDLDIGFKVFKLDSSNLKKWNPEFDNLENNLLDMVENFVGGRTEEDVLYEIMLKYGLDLTYPVESEVVNGKTIFNIGFGALFVCLANEINMEVGEYIVRKMKELDPEITRVVFKDNGFKSDDMKTNVKLKLEQAGFDEIVSV